MTTPSEASMKKAKEIVHKVTGLTLRKEVISLISQALDDAYNEGKNSVIDLPSVDDFECAAYELENDTDLYYWLKSQIKLKSAEPLVEALKVISSNGDGRGMGWTPAQFAREALAAWEGK